MSGTTPHNFLGDIFALVILLAIVFISFSALTDTRIESVLTNIGIFLVIAVVILVWKSLKKKLK